MFRRNLLALEKLVIVESPNKVIKVEGLLSDPKVIPDWSFKKSELKDISKGPEKAMAMATTGHFMFLKELSWTPQTIKAPLPADEFPSNGVLSNYALEWEIQPKQNIQETVSRYLTEKASNTPISEIIIATDPDREGELIAIHALSLIKQMYPKLNVPFTRAYIHSITAEGIQTAMENRTKVFDHNLANAAEARHAMDRIFGFLGSSVVRYANPQMRSIGRVQTPALILVNEREEKIKKFLETNKTKFDVRAMCNFTSKTGTKHSQVVTLVPKGDNDSVDWKDRRTVERISEEWKLSGAKNFRCIGSPVRHSNVSEPPEPFTMATLIAKANRQLNLTSEEVSSSLQDLFQMGYITYPRTDSSRIDEPILPSIYEAVKKEYGKNMVYKLQDRDKNKKAKKTGKKKSEGGNVEDAHEAIRPTDMAVKSDRLGLIAENTKKVYDLIYRHTLACFMIPMETERVSTTIGFTSGNGKEMTFTLQGKHATEAGWSLAYRGKNNTALETDGEIEDRENGVEVIQTVSGEEFKAIADLKDLASKKASVSLEKAQVVENKPSPPLPYSEGGLIQELKRNGVGRPSTYPMIVKTLLARNYITVVDGRCATTEVGRLLVQTSTTTFPSIVDINFTSAFEKKLDSISKPGKSVLEGYTNVTKADFVLSAFMAKFLNYVVEATKQQKANIVERSLTLKHEQNNGSDNDPAFRKNVAKERERIMSMVPDLVESCRNYRTFTALQNCLTDYLRKNFPPSSVPAIKNYSASSSFKKKTFKKKQGRFAK